MMRQIFQIIPGGTQFALKNEGRGTCAVSYQGAVVMMGGSGYPYHGKVDRVVRLGGIVEHLCGLSEVSLAGPDWQSVTDA